MTINVYLHAAKGHLYTATLASPDGEVLVTLEREPMFSTCRVLKEKGMTGVVLFYRPGRANPDFTIRDLEKAAALTVLETSKHGPEFAPYHPSSAAQEVPTAASRACCPGEPAAASA